MEGFLGVIWANDKHISNINLDIFMQIGNKYYAIFYTSCIRIEAIVWGQK